MFLFNSGSGSGSRGLNFMSYHGMNFHGPGHKQNEEKSGSISTYFGQNQNEEKSGS